MEERNSAKGQESSTCFEALRACTLRITFVFVIALGLLGSALVARFGIYREKFHTGAQGDTYINYISTWYCKGVKIYSMDNNTHFHAYVNKGRPEFSSKRLVYNSGRNFYMPSWSFQNWTMYLLKDSYLDVNICADQYLMFYVIKGKKRFSEWKQTTLFTHYHLVKHIFPKKNCKTKSQFDYYRIEAKDSDFFYILFSSSVGWRFFTHVFLKLNFNRTVYDTSRALHKCSSKGIRESCNMPLEYSSNNKVLIEYHSKAGEPLDFFKVGQIRWYPEARLKFYAGFFGGIFLSVLFLTIVYAITRCIAKRIQISKDRFPLLSVQARPTSTSESRRKFLIFPRRGTKTTLVSYEVVSQSEMEEEEEERNLSKMNEEFNASTTYSTSDQVRDLNMTAAGVSAI